jgi:hypothetical protein
MSFRSYFWTHAPLPLELEQALAVVVDPAAVDGWWLALLEALQHGAAISFVAEACRVPGQSADALGGARACWRSA